MARGAGFVLLCRRFFFCLCVAACRCWRVAVVRRRSGDDGDDRDREWRTPDAPASGSVSSWLWWACRAGHLASDAAVDRRGPDAWGGCRRALIRCWVAAARIRSARQRGIFCARSRWRFLSLPLVRETPPLAGLIYALLSGAIASGLGYTIWYAALPGLSAAEGASVQLSLPVITALAGATLLAEPITLRLGISSGGSRWHRAGDHEPCRRGATDSPATPPPRAAQRSGSAGPSRRGLDRLVHDDGHPHAPPRRGPRGSDRRSRGSQAMLRPKRSRNARIAATPSPESRW